MDLTKMISAIIVALIIASGEMPSESQLSALYKCGYWDGSKIETSTDAVMVNDGSIYYPKTKTYGESVDYSISAQIYDITPICSGTTSGESGVWYYAVLSGETTNGKICFDTKGERRITHFVNEECYCKKSGKYIYCYNKATGDTILKIKISTGKATRYDR